MSEEIDGFVIYNKSNKNTKAFGVVSEEFECKAKCSRVPNKFKQFLIPIEDKRFFDHHGIDFRGLSRAFYRNIVNMKILEGGSTISQQLARNLMKENAKTLRRKLKEVFKALEIERKFSKNEILDLYFENVYFGKNMRGIRVASLYYFDKEPENLNHSEILYLITILRGPNYYVNNNKNAIDRMKFLSNLLYKNLIINKSQYTRINKRKIICKKNRILSIKKEAVSHIVETIDFKRKAVFSTIIPYFQKLANDFVNESQYPTSVIIIKNQKVIGFSSYYGHDYPFTFKSNVGSTLKPFIYYLAKKEGIENLEKFSSTSNNLNWNVREVVKTKSHLTLDEALLNSNNNSFINVADKLGINKTLMYLSDILERPLNDLLPSTVLGATKSGISLFQLALSYNKFLGNNIDTEKQQLLEVLNKIFKSKININIDNAFLKTGTTNNNEERLAIINHADTTFAFLRNENPKNDYSKDGNIFKQIKRFLLLYINSNKDYKWNS